MAEIIFFKPRALVTGAAHDRAPTQARILFFTGVRYERVQEEDPKPAKKRGRANARKPAPRRRA